MKLKIMLIGLALVLMLCISPVAAVSGNDFNIKYDNFNDDGPFTYTYYNKNNPNEKYIRIYTEGTRFLYSLVAFKPANIPDAPVMMVDTTRTEREFYLPYHSVDEWEIKYYSVTAPICPGTHDKHLKNSVVLNLKRCFAHHLERGLILELSTGQYIYPEGMDYFRYNLRDV